MRKKWYFIAPLGIAAMALFIVVGGFLVQQLWNWLLPALFGLPSITFWQAWGILVLSRILFGGWGHHGPRGPSMRGRMRDRWKQMTPEERERFRQGMRARCGFEPPPDTGEPQ